MNLLKLYAAVGILLGVLTYHHTDGFLLTILQLLMIKGAMFFGTPIAVASYMFGQGMGFFGGTMYGGYRMMGLARNYYNKENVKHQVISAHHQKHHALHSHLANFAHALHGGGGAHVQQHHQQPVYYGAPTANHLQHLYAASNLQQHRAPLQHFQRVLPFQQYALPYQQYGGGLQPYLMPQAAQHLNFYRQHPNLLPPSLASSPFIVPNNANGARAAQVQALLAQAQAMGLVPRGPPTTVPVKKKISEAPNTHSAHVKSSGMGRPSPTSTAFRQHVVPRSPSSIPPGSPPGMISQFDTGEAESEDDYKGPQMAVTSNDMEEPPGSDPNKFVEWNYGEGMDELMKAAELAVSQNIQNKDKKKRGKSRPKDTSAPYNHSPTSAVKFETSENPDYNSVNFGGGLHSSSTSGQTTEDYPPPYPESYMTQELPTSASSAGDEYRGDAEMGYGSAPEGQGSAYENSDSYKLQFNSLVDETGYSKSPGSGYGIPEEGYSSPGANGYKFPRKVHGSTSGDPSQDFNSQGDYRGILEGFTGAGYKPTSEVPMDSYDLMENELGAPSYSGYASLSQPETYRSPAKYGKEPKMSPPPPPEDVSEEFKRDVGGGFNEPSFFSMRQDTFRQLGDEREGQGTSEDVERIPAPNSLIEKFLEEKLEEEIRSSKSERRKRDATELIELLRKCFVKEFIGSLDSEGMFEETIPPFRPMPDVPNATTAMPTPIELTISLTEAPSTEPPSTSTSNPSPPPSTTVETPVEESPEANLLDSHVIKKRQLITDPSFYHEGLQNRRQGMTDTQALQTFKDEIGKFFLLVSILDHDKCLMKLVCDVHAKAPSNNLTPYEQNIVVTFRVMNDIVPLNVEDATTNYRKAAKIGELGKNFGNHVCDQVYPTCAYSTKQIVAMGSQVASDSPTTTEPSLPVDSSTTTSATTTTITSDQVAENQ